jgi:hypothetical protein
MTRKPAKEVLVTPAVDEPKPYLRMSVTTLRKHLKAVQSVLQLAGPADYHNRDGLGILEKVPFLRPPRAPEPKEPRIVSAEVLNLCYLAGVCMDRPRLPRPPSSRFSGGGPCSFWHTTRRSASGRCWGCAWIISTEATYRLCVMIGRGDGERFTFPLTP